MVTNRNRNNSRAETRNPSQLISNYYFGRYESMRSKYTTRNIKLHLKISQAYKKASELLLNETFIEEKPTLIRMGERKNFEKKKKERTRQTKT